MPDSRLAIPATVQVSPPIVDRRHRLTWQQRLPGRIGTGALWIGSTALLGPLKFTGLLLVGGLLAPALLWLDRQRQGAPQPLALVPALPVAVAEVVPRSDLACRFGLPESLLFRARHAALCTVHHDAEGHIVALELPGLTPQAPIRTPDAHPVG